MSVAPCWVFAHFMIGIAVAVRLLIGLVHDIDAPAVTKLIEVFAVGIVAGAQKVDIGLLHQAKVLFVSRIVDVAPCAGMVIVAIDTTQFHVLAVNLKHLANTFHALHAKMVVEVLDGVTLFVLQFHAEGVEVRLLGRPKSGILQCVMEYIISGVAGVDLHFCHAGR